MNMPGLSDYTTWIFATEAEASSEAVITAFSFAEQTGSATINSETGTINIEVENGTDVTNLVAEFTLSPGASAEVNSTVQDSGVDFHHLWRSSQLGFEV